MTLQIAWIEKADRDDEPDTAARVNIWSPHGPAIFDEEIKKLPNGRTGEILDRAAELLEKGGFKFHTAESTANGWAAIVEYPE